MPLPWAVIRRANAPLMLRRVQGGGSDIPSLPMTTFSHSLPAGRVASFALSIVLGSFLAVTLSAQANSNSAWRLRKVSAQSLSRGFVAEPLVGDALRPAERAFLAKAVESSRQHIRIAEAGVSQAANSDVRSHALQLVTDYRALNDALDALIRRKGGTAGAPVGDPAETHQKLVEKSGSAFDREFVRMVARMGDEMLAMFEQVVSESKDTDVRDLAAAQLPVLRAHRKTITELKKTID